MNLNLAELIEQHRISQGSTKTWLAEQANIKYKTYNDRITNNRFEQVEDFIRLAKILNIDLEELKNKI